MDKPAPTAAPCPFCGAAPACTSEVDLRVWAVVCDDCDAIGPAAQTEAAAIAKWNAANAPDGAVIGDFPWPAIAQALD